MSWRYYPLRDTYRKGILAATDRKPVIAAFYTPEQAKELAQRKALSAERAN